jgi:hypothetical protein
LNQGASSGTSSNLHRDANRHQHHDPVQVGRHADVQPDQF